MDQEDANVVTIHSDSENDLEIISESVPNYGNYSAPVEVSPELQEKIRISLEKRAIVPGKIKTIKVYATKRSSQVMGSVRASFRPTGGQPTKTINLGASINDLFSNQVRGGGNNNSKRPQIATTSDSAEQVETLQKWSQQPLPVGADQRVAGRPSTPSSPVILYSPIRKRKSAKPKNIRGRAFPTLGFQQTVTHPPENPSLSTPSSIPWKKNISQCLDGVNVSHESSKTEMKTSAEFQVKTSIPKIKYDLSLCDLNLNTSDAVLKTKLNTVELSPIRFSSDDDDEQPVEDSILGIWNSPVSSPQNCVGSLLDLEQNSPLGKVNNKECVDGSEDSKDSDVNEKILQNMPMHLVKQMWEKMNEDDNISTQKYLYEKETKINEEEESNLENLVNQFEQNYNDEKESVLYKETDKITDVYNEEHCSKFGSEKQNSKDKFAMSKYIKINVETLPKRLFGSSVFSDNEVSDPPLWSIKDGSDPPLWSTIFPPTPPSPPPESWMSCSALWELDAGGFEAITGLCSHQTANQFKRKRNAPKPRLLRKRNKKEIHTSCSVTE